MRVDGHYGKYINEWLMAIEVDASDIEFLMATMVDTSAHEN